ncbi:hypothetical protein M8C21_026810 [Ambrosia artemisiifolia]|uniref:DUF8039 domain-containing protein n=1 Tax=Ambrosia artemisiifolia TaxID=4212 RepID=A0AAD5G4F3_AMBAR|nr:hypothetical protein M8C21_026810 [Ambrosia artemisiifolia]
MEQVEVQLLSVTDGRVNCLLNFCGPSYGSDGPVDYPPIKSHTKCEMLISVADKLVKVANGEAWPSTSTEIHCSPIAEGCIKVTVDDIVDARKKLDLYNVTKTSEVAVVEDLVHQIVQWPRYAIRLLNQGTPNKLASSPRVDSSRGSQSFRDDSPEIHNDDTTITSSYFPQSVDEENYHLPLQMENQELFAGGFLLSMEQQQTATNVPVRVPVRKPEPKTKTEPVPVLEHVPKPVEPQITLINGSEYDTWDDVGLDLALEKVRKKTGLIRVMFDQLHEVVGTRRQICTSSPQGMYPKSVTNLIAYSELLRLFSRDWLDISVLHTFAM